MKGFINSRILSKKGTTFITCIAWKIINYNFPSLFFFNKKYKNYIGIQIQIINETLSLAGSAS